MSFREAEKALDEALTALSAKYPFCYAIASNARMVLSRAVPTAAVTKSMKFIIINPDFFLGLPSE